MDRDLLAIYLTDHLAGAAAGSRRMQRLAEAERSAPDADALRRVATGVESDRAALMDMMRSEGIEPRRYKMALARAVEMAGLLKTNGRIFERSPLSSVVELEGLRMGVVAKQCLWHSLRGTELSARYDFSALLERAEQQLEVLDQAHARRAGDVFGQARETLTRSNVTS